MHRIKMSILFQFIIYEDIIDFLYNLNIPQDILSLILICGLSQIVLSGTSQVFQWLTIFLPMEGTRI